MCRFEILGSGLLYWQRRDPHLDKSRLSRNTQPACSTRSSSPSSASRPPLFNAGKGKDAVAQDDFPLLSPPEKALLASVAHLSRLHARLQAHTSAISSSHPSVVCRSVSTTIATVHLGEFQKKILDVEKAILAEDSGYVGGYGIVPLSTIVGEFAPWTRRMEWLWEIARFIQPETKKIGCKGAELIDKLRAELQTGYLDIKEMAVQLVTAAETAWMKQLSMWLLYGNLPMYGKEDFLIHEDVDGEDDETQFSLRADLIPKFVPPQTAASILFIGKSLNHIRAKRKISTRGVSTAPVTIHQEHIEQLAGLKSPISSAKMSTAVDGIRLSLSQSTLSKLLPLPRILEILTLLHDFLLLGRGEFAVALVLHADARIEENHRRRPAPGRELEGLTIKEGDVITALAHAWAELVSLQNEDDPADEELDLARDLLRLSISDRKNGRAMTPSQGPSSVAEISRVSFEDLLFPTPTYLTAQVRAPLDLFLSTSDIAIYSKIHSYLLGIRRAQIRLGDLWKRTSLRRTHPSPWGPPRSNSAFGQSKLKMSRERDNARIRQMRPVWATCSACLFVLSEIGSFFQGEVVNESWQDLREWIEGDSSASPSGSRPGTASSSKSAPPSMGRHDPEALTVAHRRHLSSLVESLFLTEVPFTAALRALLTSIDRFVALAIRLETIQRNMDLEMDEGVVDALVDYGQEEREVWHELRTTRTAAETGLQDLVARLQEIDDSRSGDNRRTVHLSGPGPDFCHYEPRKPAGVDRLLMKLDFGRGRRDLGLETAAAGFA